MAKQADRLFSHWHQSIPNLQESPQKFYNNLVEAISLHNIPGIDISRIDYREGGVLSAKRLYLRVKRKELIFDICAAPFGNGFFFSWWLGDKLSMFWRLVLVIPFLGIPLMATFRPETYFRHDTALMFQDSIAYAVYEVIDGITKAKGLRPLSELEKKPILSDFFKR
ncbi:MAG: hypothetical protein GY797_10690 [Deltaproteobacteria bacterium]|nr:hypothetical protein [Deltaproteobacteria bacterium]